MTLEFCIFKRDNDTKVLYLSLYCNHLFMFQRIYDFKTLVKDSLPETSFS